MQGKYYRYIIYYPIVSLEHSITTLDVLVHAKLYARMSLTALVCTGRAI